MLHTTLFVPVLLYDTATMIWREKGRSRKGLLGIRRIYKVPNEWIRELLGVFSGGSATWREYEYVGGVCR